MAPDTKIPNSFEIDQALKEFETNSSGQQMQKTQQDSKIPETSQTETSGVKFETDSYKAVKFYNETSTPKMVQLVMKWSGGAIKEQKQAEYILFGFVLLAIGVSLFLFFSSGNTSPEIPPEVLEQMKRTQSP